MTMGMLLPPGALNRAAYEAAGGYAALAAALADVTCAREALMRSDLRGLGGAGFPFARKLALALGNAGPRAVVCNAAEDEPGSLKDRELLTRNPHAVLEGALIAVAALDANVLCLYVTEQLSQTVRRAVSEIATDTTLCRTAIHVATAPSSYVAGEASAAVSFLNGGDPKPSARPPYPTDSGVAGKPTLVSNCETLANLPRLIRNGASTTRLATVSGDVARSGVYEIDPTATTIARLIELAGGLTGSGILKAVQPGGPSTALLDAAAADTLLTTEALTAAGSHAGCLAVEVFSTARCVVEALERITGFFAAEQCGQCPPCRMKTQTYHRTIHQIQSGHGSWDMLDKLAAVEEFVSDMPRRCSLIDMPTSPVASARVLFPDDFAHHIEYGMCPAGEAVSSPSSRTGTLA